MPIVHERSLRAASLSPYVQLYSASHASPARTRVIRSRSHRLRPALTSSCVKGSESAPAKLESLPPVVRTSGGGIFAWRNLNSGLSLKGVWMEGFPKKHARPVLASVQVQKSCARSAAFSDRKICALRRTRKTFLLKTIRRCVQSAFAAGNGKTAVIWGFHLSNSHIGEG